MIHKYEDVAECAWCGEMVVLVEDTRSQDKLDLVLGGQRVATTGYVNRKVWVHKVTEKLHCANGKSAAYPKESEHYGR